MKVNDYVFHKEFGLGIIKKLDDYVDVEFLKSGSKKLVNNDKFANQFLKVINKNVINYLINANNFPGNQSLILKGKNYFRNGNVNELWYDSNKLSAIVVGNYSYHVNLNVINDKLIYDCSCPVDGLCKHCLAVLFKANNEVNELNRKIEVNKGYQIGLKLGDEKLEVNFNYDFSTYLGFYNAFTEFEEKYINNIDYYMYQLEILENVDKSKIDDILAMLLMSDYSKHKVRSFIERKCRSSYIQSRYHFVTSKIKKECSNSYYHITDTEWGFKKLICNSDYETFIYHGMISSEKDNIISFLIDADIPSKFNLKSLFISAACRHILNDKVLTYIKKISTNEEFTSFIKMIELKDLSIDSILKIFSKEDLIEILFNEYIPSILDYVCDEIEFFYKLNKRKTIQSLALSYKLCNKRQKGRISRIIVLEEDVEYLLNYMEDSIENIYFNEYISYDKIKKYFDFYYDIIEKNNDLVVVKQLAIGLDSVFTINKFMTKNKIKSEDCPSEYYEKIDNLLDIGLVEIYGEKYKNEIQNKLIKIQEKNKKKYIDTLNLDLINLEESLISEDIYLSSEALIDVEFSFTYYLDYCGLSLRVGRDKKYVVKNIYNFLTALDNNQFVEYGKGLSFSHCYENFNVVYVDALKYLSNISSYSFNGKEVRLSFDKVGVLLAKLKGISIIFNGDNYLVRLDKYDFKMFIDKEYKIKSNVDKYSTYCFGNSCFVFDKHMHIIDFISQDKNEISLLKFAKKYKNQTIKDNVNSFINHLYTYLYDKIEISEEIKANFIIKNIDIKAYFDYLNKKIVVRTEIYNSDGIKVAMSDLNKNEIGKYNKFFNYLANLGFVNNELSEDSKILNFISMDFSNLRKLCQVYLSDSLANKKVEVFSKQVVVIKQNSTVMEVFVQDSNYSNDELDEILKAIKLKKKYVLLKNDRIVCIDNEEANDFYETINDLRIDKKKVLNSQKLPFYQVINAYAHQNNCHIDDYLLNMIDEISNFKNYNVEVPKLNATLREYQIEGFKWLSILEKYHLGGILADDMGLGKTIQMIALMKNNNLAKPSLIVCPKTLIFNWKSEFQKFAEDMKVVEIYGLSNAREKIINNIDYNENVIYITSYDSLRLDIDLYKGKFKYLVLDEAQVIKNVYASKSQAVKSLKSLYRFALTGTPVENNVIDLWSIFDFIMPGYFEELSEFKSMYSSNEDFVEKIAKRISPFVLRRTKGSVLKDLPNKYERIITTPMYEVQQKIYDSYKLEAQNILANGGKSFDVFPHLLKLRQICIDPNLFIEEYNYGSGKMDTLKEIILEYLSNNHKLLIFSQFVKALNIVKEFLDIKGIDYYFLTGETDAEDRIKYANDFNGKDNVKVFLISLKAGGTGLNLIGADTVIHLDPWWNQAVEQQATDRTYRIGQQKNVEVIKLICEDSIEKRVIELQNLKKDLIDKLISNDDSSITKLSFEDLSYILK